MKFGTRYLNGREQAIVRGSDGAVRALADVTGFTAPGTPHAARLERFTLSDAS